jgi:lipopolysaccharide transport system permease protein
MMHFTVASGLRIVVSRFELILQLAKREVVGRYRGSALGLLWSFFNPIFMLVIYTFFFSVIFKTKWGTGVGEGKTEFAIMIFSGLIVFNLFSESISKSPALILNNVNYVKKVVFPLEILSPVSVLASTFHALVSLFVLLVFVGVVRQGIAPTVLYIPIILTPLLVLTLGLSWVLAAVGVYLRDVSQTIGLFLSALMFLSPIFFPVSVLPAKFQKLMTLNPLTFIIEETRAVLILGQQPHWLGLVIYLLVASLIAMIGLYLFQKARKGFADVL